MEAMEVETATTVALVGRAVAEEAAMVALPATMGAAAEYLEALMAAESTVAVKAVTVATVAARSTQHSPNILRTLHTCATMDPRGHRTTMHTERSAAR